MLPMLCVEWRRDLLAGLSSCTVIVFPLITLLMEDNKLRPPLLTLSSSTSECLRLAQDGRAARQGFCFCDTLRIFSLISLAVTRKADSDPQYIQIENIKDSRSVERLL